MAEQQVIFLEMPQIGQGVKLTVNNKTLTSSPIQKVELVRNGIFRVFTQSGNTYVGHVCMPTREVRQEQPKQQEQTIVTPPPQPSITNQTPQPPATPPAPPQQPQVKAGNIVGGCLAVVLILVAFMVIGSLFSSGMDTSEEVETDFPSSDYTSTQPSEKFSLLDWEFADGHIRGSIKNNTNDSYGYVQVEFNLYDAAGSQVGSTFANVNNVEPGGVWKFDTYVLEDNAATAKCTGISGF